MNLTLSEVIEIEEALQTAVATSYRQAAPELIALGWIKSPALRTEAQITAEITSAGERQHKFGMRGVVTGARRSWKRGAGR